MRTGVALILVFGGGLLIYSAFKTPPDPRIVLGNLLTGQPLGSGMGSRWDLAGQGLGGSMTGVEGEGGMPVGGLTPSGAGGGAW